MWLPTKAQVDTAGRYAAAVAGTAITIFGLQAKGITLDEVKALIAALGDTVNSLVTLIGVAATLYAAVKGVTNSSPSAQVASVSAMPQVQSMTLSDVSLATAAKNADPTTEVKVQSNG